jgi:hypothetical protein
MGPGGLRAHGREPHEQPYTREREVAMNFILWLIIGGILGWLASMVLTG